MKMSTRIVCWSLFFFLTTPCSLHAQVKSPRDIQRSCRTFVQGFYDWYVPKWLIRDLDSSSTFEKWLTARDPLKYKTHVLSPELFRLLKEDYAAQAKVEGEIVGLDFNPFIGGNSGPEGRCVVGNVTRKVDSYRVEVYCMSFGKKSEKPDVVPEVMFNRGRWLFVNFRYGEGDLLSALKELREERQKRPR